MIYEYDFRYESYMIIYKAISYIYITYYIIYYNIYIRFSKVRYNTNTTLCD